MPAHVELDRPRCVQAPYTDPVRCSAGRGSLLDARAMAALRFRHGSEDLRDRAGVDIAELVSNHERLQ